jgi:Prolyl oligopeptidase, N-terminal beta-propeller domain
MNALQPQRRFFLFGLAGLGITGQDQLGSLVAGGHESPRIISHSRICSRHGSEGETLMARSLLRLLVSLSLAALMQPAEIAQSTPPTPKRPVKDEYHGAKVVDDYRWLEDWDNPEVKQWSAAEDAKTRLYLDHLPARPEIKARVAQLLRESSSRYFGMIYQGGTLFAIKSQPPKQQSMLVALRSADDPGSEKVIVDPNAMSEKGAIAIDFYVPSIDGKLVAVSLSEGGSEDGMAHVVETATGKELADRVPRVNFGTAGGSFAWNVEALGFITRGIRREMNVPLKM